LSSVAAQGAFAPVPTCCRNPPRQIILGRASIKKLSSVAAQGAFAPVPTCCRNQLWQLFSVLFVLLAER